MPSEQTVKTVNEFCLKYYNSRVWTYRTFWRGVQLLKNPLDMWIYQQLIHQLRPDLIIELGTFRGGSALFFADVLQLENIKHGCVVTVDIEKQADLPKHPRINYLPGSTLSMKVRRLCKDWAKDRNCVMVIADSCHEAEHVAKELKYYHSLVTPGSYFIVEDATTDEGPRKAIADFLASHPQFEQDMGCQQFLMTFNSGGYLRRVK